MAGRLSRRDLENTRVDLRRWSEQLIAISGELTALVEELSNDNGGNGGGAGAGQAEEPGRGDRGDP